MCLPCEFFNRKKSLYKFNPFFMPFLDRKKNFERETLNQLEKKTSWRLSLSWVVKSNFCFVSLASFNLSRSTLRGSYPSCQFTQFHNRLARVLYFVCLPVPGHATLTTTGFLPKKICSPGFLLKYFKLTVRHLRALPSRQLNVKWLRQT
jgi:hypothetical protein